MGSVCLCFTLTKFNRIKYTNVQCANWKNNNFIVNYEEGCPNYLNCEKVYIYIRKIILPLNFIIYYKRDYGRHLNLNIKII